MKLSLKPQHLKRYKDIFYLFRKYGRADFTKHFELEETLAPEEISDTANAPKPEELADDLEKLGPTYVKLGQLLSSRPDLLPEPYLKALARLQDKVKPFSFAEVEQIVTTELGVRLSKGFAEFETEPLAAASLGQVHRATLRDGRVVVVKVQRPDIRKQIAEDFVVLEEIAEFMDAHTETGRRYRLSKILDEFKTTLLQELDYQREATNLNTLAENLKDFENIRVPRPILDYTTRSVLTMEYVTGTKITKLSPLVHLDINGGVLAEDLFRAYLKQVLVDGLFHADPHPGNIFLTENGRVALLDLGMVGRTTPAMQENLLKLLLAISEGSSEQALEIVLSISETAEDFDEPEFRRKLGHLISEHQNINLGQIDIGKTLLAVTKTSAETGLYVPSELTMLGKTLLQLDQVGKILAPDFNPNASVQRNASEILTRRAYKNLSPAKMLGSLLEMKDFVGGLPGRVNKILDTVANAELEIKIKTPETSSLMEGLQKVANRITTGLILAALIVGASILMQIHTPFEIFGYPGLAILCFIGAAAGGIWLVLSIAVHDYRDRRRTR